MEKFRRAIDFAFESHQGQVDKAGNPYILHPLAVASSVGSYKEDVLCAAVLHDVLEDTYRLPWEIIHYFGQRVGELVALLTHPKWEPYDQYILRVASDWDAAIIKRADIIHNQIRLFNIKNEEMQKRLIEKYRKGLSLLESKMVYSMVKG